MVYGIAYIHYIIHHTPYDMPYTLYTYHTPYIPLNSLRRYGISGLASNFRERVYARNSAN
ncbi:hypothetical protein EON63_09900 [archaeon]|nr:MAG: hypothetical protein EON63_09900 [archaeon]